MLYSLSFNVGEGHFIGDGPVKDYLTAQEVAEVLHIGMSTAYKLMERGEIPVVRSGKFVRVRPEDLEEYMQRIG